MSHVNFNRKILCKNCTEDIFATHNVLIRCKTCDDLDLCPDCFMFGAVLGDHEPHHPYQVIDNGGFCILGSDWSAREHIRLLDSIEQYGYGNWEDVAKKVVDGSSSDRRLADEVKAEFGNNFISGAIGRHTWHEEERGRARDHTLGNPLLPPSQPSEPPPNLTLTETIMLGYMAKRDDFEVEYENGAEGLVSPLQFSNINSEEEEVDVALMNAHVDMYKFKLRERERRKRVARDHQLISSFFKENPVCGEKKPASQKKKKDRTDVTERLKILAEFQGVAEHQAFMANIGKEKDLKAKIKDLVRFRKNGIAQLKDSTDYEIQRLRRIKRKNEQRKRLEQQQQMVDSPRSVKSEDFSNGGSPLMFNQAALSPAKVPGIDDKMSAIIGLPGYEVLSMNERKLCANLRLTPAHYISYKTCLLTNHLQKKKGQTPKPLNPDGLDKNNRKIIFQFLMRAGWITAY